MWLGLGEAIANLALSIGLVLATHSVVAVAVGSFIPTLYFGWVHLWPWMAKDTGLRGWPLFRQTVIPSWLGCLPMLAVLVGLKWVVLAPRGSGTIAMFTEGTIAGVIGGAGLWKVSLRANERDELRRKMGRFLPRRWRVSV